jgi:hypothetical protein
MGFADFICNQIHSFVSQLHQHGKLGPEWISNQLWDLTTAVKHIAMQYAVDNLSHSPSAADRTDDDEFLRLFLTSSNLPPSGNQNDLEPYPVYTPPSMHARARLPRGVAGQFLAHAPSRSPAA